MSITPLAQYLTDFGSDRDAGQPIRIELDAPADEEVLVATAEQLAAEVGQAHARGVEEGRAEAARDYEQKLAEQQSAFEAQLSRERQAWIADTGERLAGQLTTGLADLARSQADTTVQLLEPFLAARIREQALAEIRANLEVLLAKNDIVTIDVSGPEDLLEELRERLSGTAATVSYTPGSAADVRIAVDQTVFETRIADWLAALREGAR